MRKVIVDYFWFSMVILFCYLGKFYGFDNLVGEWFSGFVFFEVEVLVQFFYDWDFMGFYKFDECVVWVFYIVEFFGCFVYIKVVVVVNCEGEV